MEQFLTFFRVVRVCQRQLGFLVYSTPVSVVSRNGSSRVCQCLYTTTYDLVTARTTCCIYERICVRSTVLRGILMQNLTRCTVDYRLEMR